MMEEKRFKGYAEKTGRHHELIIIDSLGEEYSITDDFFKSKDVIFDIVDLLNVMNDTLLKQADENHKLSNKNIEQQAIIEAKDSLLSVLSKENEQLRQILKDIVEVTDETYTKNTSMFKVTVVLDYEKYREIRRCIE